MYKIVGQSDKGVYVELSNGKVEYIFWNEIKEHELMSKVKEKFEEDWPSLWREIKETLPSGPTIPITPQPQTGLIQTPPDLYFLTILDFLLSGICSRTIGEKVLKEISKSKEKPFEKVLFALGIKEVGEGTAKLLAKHFNSLDELGRASPEKLFSIEGLGETRIRSIFTWFHTEGNWKEIEKLRLGGLDYAFGYQALEEEKMEYTGVEIGRIESVVPSVMETSKKDIHWTPGPIPNPIKGKVFMFTGKLTLFTREKAQALVEAKGGIAGTSVSKNTDFLVVGEKPGSKLVHATLLNIPTLTEEEFLELTR